MVLMLAHSQTQRNKDQKHPLKNLIKKNNHKTLNIKALSKKTLKSNKQKLKKTKLIIGIKNTLQDKLTSRKF